MGTGKRALTRVLLLSGCSLAFGVAGASAAVTPGWECVPTTAGQAVVSGGTAASPSCGSGTTPVLAPTYVSSGVGGKPTVEFSTVNVQVISGSGSTSGAVNGEGNLIVGYAENPGGHPQTGSNDLVLGSNDGWSSYGQLVGGTGNVASGAYAGVLGEDNIASGAESSVLGELNGTASATAAAISGGNTNTASGSNGAWVGGGYKNVAKGSSTTVIGGAYGQATGANASIGGGEHNIAADQYSFIGGGCDNLLGTGTASTSPCAFGGEGMLGGASLTGTAQDGTFGSISDGVNSGKNGDFKISLGLGAGACSDVPYGVPGTQVGDLATVAYETNPPPGLLIQTTGVTVAGQVEVEACNVSSATIHYDNIPIRVQTFR